MFGYGVSGVVNPLVLLSNQTRSKLEGERWSNICVNPEEVTLPLQVELLHLWVPRLE